MVMQPDHVERIHDMDVIIVVMHLSWQVGFKQNPHLIISMGIKDN